MTARVETAPPRARVKPSATTQGFARFRAPFPLRCGAILIDYITLVAILAVTTLVSRILGGGAMFDSRDDTLGAVAVTL